MDPGKAVVAVVVVIAITTTIRMVFMAAFGRRRWYGAAAESASSSLADARLARLEQAVDAIALEVERISEGQRFTTRLLSEQAKQSGKLSPELTNTPT